MNEISVTELLAELNKSDFNSVEVQQGDFKLKVIKQIPMSRNEVTENKQLEVIETSRPQSDEQVERVKAPLVGVFYTAPKKDAPKFVKTGQHVEAGDVVGLIEAMKMFNEVHAPIAGTIKDIKVANESMVEFDQELMTIKPD